MTLSLLLVTLMGVANFSLHRAMLDSGHPMVQEALAPLRRTFGDHASYAFEFLLLLGALMLCDKYPVGAVALYGLYTMLDALAFALLFYRK